MESRARNLLAGGLVLAAVAATPLTNSDLFAPRRAHVHKADAPHSVEAPSERLSDVPCEDGKAGPFDCSGVDLLGFVPEDEMVTVDTDVLTGCALDADEDEVLSDPTCLDPPGLSDIWGWTSEDGDEYVMFGKTNGVAFYRITDPTAPEYLGEIPNTSGQLLWHDIKVYDHYAYIVSESFGHGMKIFDLARLEDMDEAPVPFFPIDADATWRPDSATDQSNHNIVIDTESGYAYLVGGGVVVTRGSCSGGLYALNLNEDPLDPTYEGCWDDTYVHDAQCAVYHGPDTEHEGRQICVTSNEDSVSVVDVTDKSNMTELSRTDYEYVKYAHQGWMSEDQRFYFHGDELDEESGHPRYRHTRTIVIDIRDLDAISEYAIHEAETTSIDHNMYTKDGLLFQSNYTEGLRVLDTAAVEESGTLSELAFFDTYPDGGDAIFAGTWSNYPYFPSGTIAVSGIGEGLFLLRLQDGVVSAAAQ